MSKFGEIISRLNPKDGRHRDYHSCRDFRTADDGSIVEFDPGLCSEATDRSGRDKPAAAVNDKRRSSP